MIALYKSLARAISEYILPLLVLSSVLLCTILLNFSGYSSITYMICLLTVFVFPGISYTWNYILTRNKGHIEYLFFLILLYLALGLLTYITNLLFPNYLLNVSLVYTGIGMILFSSYMFFQMKQEHKHVSSLFTIPLADLAIITLAFLVAAFIHYINVPLTTTLNTDALAHITAMKEIFTNGSLSFDLRQISSSFTVISYLPIFHIIFGPLLGVQQQLSIVLYNSLDILFVGISGLLIYLSIAPHNRYSALLFVILHFFAFERIAAYTSLFLLPQTLCALLGIILLLNLVYKSHISMLMVILFPLLLLSVHFLIGALAAVLFYFILFFRKEFIPHFLPKILQIASFYFLIMVMLSGTSYLTYFKTVIPDYEARLNELVILDIFSFLATLIQMFGGLIILLPISLLMTLFSNNRIGVLLSIALSVVSITILVQVPYSGKLLLFFHYLTIFQMVWCLDSLKLLAVPKFIQNVSCIMLIVSLAPILVISTNLFKNTLLQNNYSGVATREEITYSQEINLLPKGTLFSDPLSMSIFEATTKHNSPGGVYTSVDKRILIWQSLKGTTSKVLLPTVANRYLVVTYRTLEWQRQQAEFVSKFANEIWEVPQNYNLVCDKYSHLGVLVIGKEDLCVFKMTD